MAPCGRASGSNAARARSSWARIVQGGLGRCAIGALPPCNAPRRNLHHPFVAVLSLFGALRTGDLDLGDWRCRNHLEFILSVRILFPHARHIRLQLDQLFGHANHVLDRGLPEMADAASELAAQVRRSVGRKFPSKALVDADRE